MHDIDRIQSEYGAELDEFQQEQFEFDFEADQEVYGEMVPESPFNEAEEMELAAELLSVSGEAELDQFLGKLFKGAWRGIRKVASGALRPLGGILKGVAKKALPFVGGALGSVIPGVGTAIGGALGSAASRLFEVELEGLSGEDQEFELARRFVRLAGAAARQAGQMPAGSDPRAAAQAALMTAARQYAPGLLSPVGFAPVPTAEPSLMAPRPGRSGRWVRRGRSIILLGV